MIKLDGTRKNPLHIRIEKDMLVSLYFIFFTYKYDVQKTNNLLVKIDSLTFILNIKVKRKSIGTLATYRNSRNLSEWNFQELFKFQIPHTLSEH